VYLVIAGFAGLARSVSAVAHARLDLLAAAGCAVALSFSAAALTYCLLAVRTIPYVPTLLVQISGGLVNRLLPAGLGGLGINALYLKRRGHTLPVATTIVATNNALGFVGNTLLLIIAVAVSPLTIAQIRLPHLPGPLVMAACILIVIAGVYISRRYRLANRVRHSLREVGGYGRQALHRPGRSLGALLSSCMVTALYATALYLVLAALHFPVTWPVALVSISAGAFTGAVVPTPGGLGGAEAGIAALLITFGVAPATAAAAAVTFRLLTYWLPLLPGYAALRVVEKRYI
jgi:undecaprenyl-diphosphatase